MFYTLPEEFTAPGYVTGAEGIEAVVINLNNVTSIRIFSDHDRESDRSCVTIQLSKDQIRSRKLPITQAKELLAKIQAEIAPK